MTDGVLRLVALTGVALLGFGLVAAVATALAHRRVATAVRALPPSFRARVLLAWAAAPSAVAIAFVAATLWPSLGAALGVSVDHCPAHAGHVHLCLHHLPARGPGVAGALGLATFAVVAGTALIHDVRSALLATGLARLRSFELAPGVGTVESSTPFALTVGWFWPSVLVSTGLVERLTPVQLDVVVAHERAHALRRDALAVTAARVLTLAHLPAVRRRILADLTLACEQACDEIAARTCGDRVLVAETIVATVRAASTVPATAAGLAFGGGEVVDRVESLLAAPLERPASRRPFWILLAAGAALAAIAPYVHHWTETLLDLLPH